MTKSRIEYCSPAFSEIDKTLERLEAKFSENDKSRLDK